MFFILCHNFLVTSAQNITPMLPFEMRFDQSGVGSYACCRRKSAEGGCRNRPHLVYSKQNELPICTVSPALPAAITTPLCRCGRLSPFSSYQVNCTMCDL